MKELGKSQDQYIYILLKLSLEYAKERTLVGLKRYVFIFSLVVLVVIRVTMFDLSMLYLNYHTRGLHRA